MAPKGTQVATGSSTKLPGSSAPTERPAYPGRLPVSAAGPDRDYRDPLVRRLGLLRFGARTPAETRATQAPS
jgi:hypothetical protein